MFGLGRAPKGARPGSSFHKKNCYREGKKNSLRPRGFPDGYEGLPAGSHRDLCPVIHPAAHEEKRKSSVGAAWGSNPRRSAR
jgi:hypothetical protein